MCRNTIDFAYTCGTPMQRLTGVLLGIVVTWSSLSLAQVDCGWQPRSWGVAGVSGEVRAFASLSNPERLVVAGAFDQFGSLPVSSLLLWDGVEATSLGAVSGPVNAVVANEFGDVFVGGSFVSVDGVSANFVAHWDGSNWWPLGTGVNGTVHALAWYDDGSGEKLYVGGSFSDAGGNATNGIAAWNGVSWEAPIEVPDGTVRALYAYQGLLYVGGDFQFVGTSSTNHLVAWDGSDWSALGMGTNDSVLCFSEFDFGSGAELVAGGAFTEAGGVVTGRTARWDGSQWRGLSGMNGTVRSLLTVDLQGTPTLYAGGTFSIASGQAIRRFARWNGSGWEGVQNEPDFTVSAMATLEGELLLGGAFDSVGDFRASGIARLQGDQLIPAGIGGGNPEGASALTWHQGALWGSAEVNGVKFVESWNESYWTPLSEAVSGEITVLLGDVCGDALFVGGDFVDIGGEPRSNVALWSAGSWESLSTGVSGPVSCASRFANGLVVGGDFNEAGSSPSNFIARWDGAQWTGLGSGLDGIPRTICECPTGIVVGGDFEVAGGLAVSHVAHWDGLTWNALGAGLPGPVTTVAATAMGDLYAGGDFSTAGYVAHWDGSSWSPLGAGVNGPVHFVCVLETLNAILVGGEFDQAGGTPVAGLALWDGTSWLPFQDGVSGIPRRSLTEVSGGLERLWITGEFQVQQGSALALGLIEWLGGGSEPSVTLQTPDFLEACLGTFETIEAAAVGTPPFSYQWLHDGSAIFGANDPTLLLGPLEVGEGGTYQLQVTGACGETLSSAIELTLEACDCDDDGIVDLDAIALGMSTDCNGNGVPDDCEIASGALGDANQNGVADLCEGALFLRGDGNCDGQVTLADAVASLSHLFAGGSACCLDAIDLDNNGTLALVDPLIVLGFLFQSGAPPAGPYPDCGLDSGGDGLDCEQGCP